MLCLSDCLQSCRNAKADRLAALRAFSRLRAAASLARSSRDCAFSLFCEGPQHAPILPARKLFHFFLCGGLPPCSCNRRYVSQACARRPRARSQSDAEPARWPNSTLPCKLPDPARRRAALCASRAFVGLLAGDRCAGSMHAVIFPASLESLGLAPPPAKAKKLCCRQLLLAPVVNSCIYLND